MINFLYQLENPQLNYKKFFEIMSEFRKGGLNPANIQDFLLTIQSLPPIAHRTHNDYHVFDRFHLSDIGEQDFESILRTIMLRGIEESKHCWHPDASDLTCNLDASGKIVISAAHSIQNNGVLSKIVENGHVTGYDLIKREIDGKSVGKNYASIFWGFCNKHDSIFQPIENFPYTSTDEQHFLFAYRGFVVSCHKKQEVSTWINFGSESENDIAENKKIFDAAISAKDYSTITTHVFELPAFYPIAVSSAFYLEFDFEGNSISHSSNRIEFIFVTLLPGEAKTYFFLSYFQRDKELYGQLAEQLEKRNNLKSDITMLIASHTENVYFNPTYYTTFIKQYSEEIDRLMFQTQFESGIIGNNGELRATNTFTPNDYLHNPQEINFFGY